MSLVINEEQNMLKSSAKELLDLKSPISLMRKLRDDNYNQFDSNLWNEMVEMGWTALTIPEEYNGLKFFNSDGEFLSKEDVSKLIEYSESKNHIFSSNNSLGNIAEYDRLIDDHVDAILNLDILPLEEIKELKLTVSADAINSGGSLAIPKLLDRLNIRYIIINSEIEGLFGKKLI